MSSFFFLKFFACSNYRNIKRVGIFQLEVRGLVLNLIMKLVSENRRDFAVCKISRRRHNCEKVMNADEYVNGFAVTAMIVGILVQ